jgi:hemoglobin
MTGPVHVVRAADLAPADPTPGMTRSRAFELPTLWAGRVETMPGAVSGWHHHDVNESSLYIVSGVLRFEFEGHDGPLDAEAGDFVHVPAFTVHRESNPSRTPSVAVIARAGGGIPTVNVDGPRDLTARPSLYEFAGGEAAFLALATAHHARCMRDPELNHPFSHPGQHPQHVERLAAYWAEVMGGPPRYSQSCGDQATVLSMHSGNGDMSDLGRRFVECFAAAADDAGLPQDPEFRHSLRAYMQWAVRDVLIAEPVDAGSMRGVPVPHWSWNGPQTAATD